MATVRHVLRMESFNMFPLPDKHRPKCACGWKAKEFVEDHSTAKAEGRLHIASVDVS